MATSEINYSSGTVVDLESDTVTPETLLEGETAHDATGASITGTMHTVPDSALLGGKAPEYYTWSNNLLHNSNFESTYLVNHLGYASGSAVSPWGEFINCWVNANDAEKTFAVSNDGINIPADTTIWQIANRVSNGDTVTIAVCDGNGDVYAASGTVHFNSDKSWYRCITCNGNNFDLYADTYQGKFEFIIYTVNDVKIKWAVLYKGAYTTDTLPQPQWLHPRLEMIRMGLETQPVNLLDNSDFRNPVNRRGQTSYTGIGYAIDRWVVRQTNVVADIQKTKLVLTNNRTDGSQGYIEQTIPNDVLNSVDNAGEAYTVAAKVNGKIYAVSTVIPSVSSVKTDGENVIYILYSNAASAWVVRFITYQGEIPLELEWAALYEGSYTAETLPPYVPKGYAVEALNCGVPVHPRNLLDNSDFTNPVNQRGVVTSGVFTYFIDRWITGSAGCTLSENGVKLVSNCWFHQRIAKETFDIYLSNGFTFCCETADGTVLTLNTVAGSGSEKIKGVNLYVANDYLDSGYYEFRIITDTSTTCTVKWAALYEGAYTAETLPTYVPKENELAACKRRFRRIGKSKTSDALVFNGYVTSSGKEIIVAIDGIEDMSNVDPTNSKPTVSYSGKIVIRGTAGYCTDATASSPMTDAIITAKYTDIGVGALLVKKSDGSAFAGLTNNTVVAVTFTEGSYIDISNDP